MGNKKHTPGPWRYTKAPMADYQYYIWHGKGSTDTVCCFNSDNEADARLIASAPEMLALLVGLLPIEYPVGLSARCGYCHDHHTHEGDDSSGGCQLAALLRKIGGGW